MTKAFDAIIIGAGQAGPPLARRLTAAGQSVAIIERKLFGGTCVNTGCTPTKTLVASAYAAHIARRAADFGVTLQGAVGIDFTRVRARQDDVVRNARDGLEAALRSMARCTVYQGHARFDAPGSVRVNDELLASDQIFIDVGGRAFVPDLPGIAEVDYLTNTSLLALERLPRHLVIVGGGSVGLEFAQIYRRFGAQVTVVEMGPRLIQREDPEVSDTIKDFLEAEGIGIRLEAECIRLRRRGDEVCVHVDCAEGDPDVIGSHVLIAVGRRPNTDDLGLEKVGVATDKRGYIVVDDELRTAAAGVWALGDCNGKGAFTHTAYNDFEVVAANLLNGEARKVSDRIVAYALYTDPPLGRAGMTDAEIRATGRRALVGARPMTRVSRAIEKAETKGFMKVTVDADSRQILGAAILGTGGDEAIHGVLDFMYGKGPCTALERAVNIHPTVSKLIPTVLGELGPLA
jgi:pyruvate/2-oxoglutarate dehydrogenase complex dihydrolipoamide dehydrogenase (E3) component